MTWDNRLTFEVSSADPDSLSPVWVNLTSRIRDNLQPVTLQSGRQNDLNQAEPARLDLLLDNSDDALTYGNTASPYTWWGPGRKCRLRELVNGVTTTRFSGFLQVPTESLITAGIEQRVSITAMDRLGKLQSGEPFISTLAAHVANSGNGVLVGYWPLLDRTQQFLPVVGQGNAIVDYSYTSQVPAPTAPVAVTPGGGDAVLADDATPVRLAPGYGRQSPCLSPALRPRDFQNLAAGQVATAVAWMKADFSMDPTPAYALFFISTDATVKIERLQLAASGAWRLGAPGTLLTGSVDSDLQAGSDHYYLLGIRYGFSPNVLELWVDDRRYVATMTGTFAGTMLINNLTVGVGLTCSVAHLQLYIGDPSAWTYTDFLAQRAIGLYGLERQTTGDRIRTIAAYAGIPAAELTQVDKGQSVMQVARLAGKDPLTAMRDAERTEQGLLYADGPGNLVFKDRSSLYNI